MKRETGYYWAFYANDWSIVFYDAERNNCLVIGGEEECEISEFNFLGTIQITKPKA